jgi:hypothetical protein
MKSILFAAHDQAGEARPVAADDPLNHEYLARPGLEAELPARRAMAQPVRAGWQGE